MDYNLIDTRHAAPCLSPDIINELTATLPADQRYRLQTAAHRIAVKKQHRLKDEEAKMHSDVLDKISKEDLFRFGYEPFVIAQLVWDYADTVLDMASLLKIEHTRETARRVKRLRKDYDKLRDEFLDSYHRASEKVNAEMYEDMVQDLLETWYIHIRADISRQHPDVTGDRQLLVIAVHQCCMLLEALFGFVNRQQHLIEKKVGRTFNRILPKQLYDLYGEIYSFADDIPLSEPFLNQQKTYISALTNRMWAIRFTGEPVVRWESDKTSNP